MTKYPYTELEHILGSFSIEEKAFSFRPLTDGFINDTFLVLDNDKPLYILQRINHKVFTNVEGLMNNVRNAFEHLKDEKYTAITLVRSRSGENYFMHQKDGSNYWRLMTYIDGSTAYNTTEDPKIAFEAGRIIGKFNALLQEADPENYVDTIPRFHDLELREEQFKQALQNADANKLKIAENTIKFANDILGKLENVDLADNPVRVCHNDTKLNNILFSQKTEKALCLIDLDTLMRGYFYYDFGDAVRTIVNTAPEDEQDHEKITFRKDLFEAFVDGLATNNPFLSAKEIHILPWGAILMPFLHGLRALTDYLNNNIYYKVSYENQNLDRSLSLFDFTKKALENLNYMETIVDQKLVKA